MKRIALFNIGANSKNIGRGPIFSDGSFKFIPIPENGKRSQNPYSYNSLGLSPYVSDELMNASVHYDPHFPTATYGHVTRGHGYEKILEKLERNDVLAFYSTLDYKDNKKPQHNWIDRKWGTYIVGAYCIKNIYTNEDFLELTKEQRSVFQHNPHYFRKSKIKADYWVEGYKKKSRLFSKAFPIYSLSNRERGNEFIRTHFLTSGGKPADSHGFYRAASICENDVENVWEEILNHSF